MYKRHTLNRRGFSMVEMLAVVALTAVVSITSIGVLIAAQTRSTRAGRATRVRQEGKNTMDTITYFLRNARYLEANQSGETCQSGMKAIRIHTKDDQILEFYEYENRIASNSGSVIVTPPQQYLASSLVSTDESLSFDCSQASDDYGALVEISFTYSAGAADGPTDLRFVEPFRESVYIRSYQ